MRYTLQIELQETDLENTIAEKWAQNYVWAVSTKSQKSSNDFIVKILFYTNVRHVQQNKTKKERK